MVGRELPVPTVLKLSVVEADDVDIDETTRARVGRVALGGLKGGAGSKGNRTDSLLIGMSLK